MARSKIIPIGELKYKDVFRSKKFKGNPLMFINYPYDGETIMAVLDLGDTNGKIGRWDTTEKEVELIGRVYVG